MDAFEVLVIILSVLTAIFLIISIICALLVLQVLKRLKAASEKAEHVAMRLDSFAEQLQATGGKAAMGSAAAKVLGTFLRTIRRR